MTSIRLNDRKNKYVIDNEEYARVTQIVDMLRRPELEKWKVAMGAEESERIAGEAAEYGELVHEVTMWNDKGKMDKVEKMLEEFPFLVPPWVAWFDWVDKNVTRIIAVERIAWSRKYKCAGKIDRVLLIRGDKYPSIWDIKTGGLYDEIGIQQAGYKILWNEKHTGRDKVRRFGAINLPRKNPGDLRPKEYTDKKYEDRFKHLARAYQLK